MKKIIFLVSVLFICFFSFSILQVTMNINGKPSDGLDNNPNDITVVNNITNPNSFYRDVNSIDYSSLKFTTWDVKTASKQVKNRKAKPYTIMVYMNGSDLESENGSATDDLIEMLESGLDSKNANLVLFTGGANRWQNDIVPENECVIWEIEDGNLNRITGVGLVNMGDPGTLSSFIDFSITNFPADKYGLILWDHGGGSIAGYGKDEKYNDSNLMLLAMNYAFEKSLLSKDKLEFLGFDSCMMATVEMAVIASNYAKYLIASEETEPDQGWDYSFLAELNNNPKMDGVDFGKTITDYFIKFYGEDPIEDLTLSVTDLSKVDRVMGEMGKLMNECSNVLIDNNFSNFRTLAKKRYGTKTFGASSPINTESDMVDIGDMANKLSDLFPVETENLKEALDEAVVYNRFNLGVDLSGLSTYYIFRGKEDAEQSLKVYQSLNMDKNYTDYLLKFYKFLMDDSKNTKSRQNNKNFNLDNVLRVDLTMWEPVKSSANQFIMTGIQYDVDANTDENEIKGYINLWPQIYGHNICLYKLSSTPQHTFYAVPSNLNGKDCDLIIVASKEYPNGLILGTRQEEDFIIQKGFDKIQLGDKISFYYVIKEFGDNDEKNINWHKGNEFTVDNNFGIQWAPVSNTNYGLMITDVQNKEQLTYLNTDINELFNVFYNSN